MLRIISYNSAGKYQGMPIHKVILEHDERHIRRKILTVQQGLKVLVDLAEATMFHHGDVLVLEDGGMVEIIAAEEPLYEIRPGGRMCIAELAWHLGNRHIAAQIEESRIVILRDHIIRAMLEGLGAEVSEITEQFQPIHGAYHSSHSHEHAHEHAKEHHQHK